jgi:ABC-type antimicrobial peptide transport system permease subunit
VVAQSARYLVAGLAIGLPAAWFVTRAFGSLYFGVTPANPFVYLSVAAVTMAAGLAATVLPAARAARVDPIEVLRQYR